MMLTEIVFLGLIQGLTEFLPVSSSGHLLAARYFFPISDSSGPAFDAFLHLGTLGAVLVYFHRRWLEMIRSVVVWDDSGREPRELMLKIAVATVPAAGVGYLFQDVADKMRSAELLVGALVFTAVILWISDIMGKRADHDVDRLGILDAVMIGVMQIFALVPGVSRSGVTIAGGRFRGLSRRDASNFSFLLSAPIIAGASLSGFLRLWRGDSFSLVELGLACLVSFISGLLTIKIFLRFVEKISLRPFAMYLLGLAYLVWLVGS